MVAQIKGKWPKNH